MALRLCAAPTDNRAAAPDGNGIPSEGPVRLPYRMVFAVATKNSVGLYDTQVLPCPGSLPYPTISAGHSLMKSTVLHGAAY